MCAGELLNSYVFSPYGYGRDDFFNARSSGLYITRHNSPSQKDSSLQTMIFQGANLLLVLGIVTHEL